MSTGNTYTWTGAASKNLYYAGNWFDDTTGGAATSVPGPIDTASVAAAGTLFGPLTVTQFSIDGTGQGATVEESINASLVSVAGTVTLAPNATLQTGDGDSGLTVGSVPQGAGTLTLNHADATLPGAAVIGDGTTGSFTLSNGSTLVSSALLGNGGAYAVSLGTGGGSGTLSIASQSLMTTDETVGVGDGGQGELDVASASLIENPPGDGSGVLALEVAVQPGDSGLVNVQGGLIEDTTASGMVIGLQGAGTLTVAQVGSQGGTVLTGGYAGELSGPYFMTQPASGLRLGLYAGSSGTVSVSGSASGLGVYGNIIDGDFGNGLLALSDGARLVDGYSATDYGLVLGNGGTGTMTMTGVAQAGVLGETIVGQNSFGTLSITGGSSFSGTSSSVGALVVASGIGATGGVLISDHSTYVPLFGALVVAEGGKASVTIQNEADVAITVPAFSLGVVIGAYASGAVGTLSLASGATLTTSGYVQVGDTGYGELDVTNGTLIAGVYLPFYDYYAPRAIDAGVETGSDGVINVAGGLIEDTAADGMIIGDAGTGTLNITQNGSQGGTVLTGYPYGPPGLTLGEQAGSSGVVSVTGSASGLGVYGSVADGQGGNGIITLSAGARFVAGYTADSFGLTLGGNDQGSGKGVFTVTGGAQAYVLGSTEVGYGGNGTLTVDGGSSFSSTSNDLWALEAGFNTGAQGTVLISDPSTYVPLTGGMVVGDGGTGTVTVQNQALLNVVGGPGTDYPGIIVGYSAGVSGTLSIDSNATLEASTSMVVGSSGTGLLSVAGGTLVSSADPSLGIPAISAGVSAGSSGTIVVSSGLIEDTTLAGMVVGGVGDGTLTISNAGSATSTVVTGDPATSYGLSVGIGSGSVGTISVSGVNSSLGVDGSVLDGGSGTGAISVSDGAQFVAGSNGSAGELVLGGASGTGFLSVASGAQANIAGQIQVGDIGSGTLSVTSGGTLTGEANGSSGQPALLVGNGPQGIGTVLISDSSTSVSLAAGVVMQDGSLTVENGAQLSTGTLQIVSGLVTVSGAGATLDAQNVSVGVMPGNASLTIGAGGYVYGLAVYIDAPVSLSGGTLAANQAIVSAAIGTVSGSGTILALNLFDNGTIDASTGTLSLDGTITGVGSLAISGGALLALGGVAGPLTTETNTIVFETGGGTLTAAATTPILGTITGWSAGDFIGLQDISATTDSFANGTLSLFGTSSQLVGTLDFAGSNLSTQNFTLTTPAGGGTEIAYHS